MKHIKKQKLITNIGGLLILAIVIVCIILQAYIVAIIISIIGILFYLSWRRFDKRTEEDLIKK